jgi:purine-binding chemotaxis protein CheW
MENAKNPPDTPAAESSSAPRVTLPPFGMARDILRQMGTPDHPLPASSPAAQAPPAAGDGASSAHQRARYSLLQFADAVMADAQRDQNIPEPEHEEHLVTFFVQREEYGVPVLRSREIVRVGEITRIPEAPHHIRGVFNLRGRILPVVDLATRLGLKPSVVTPRSRLLLVEAHGRLFALLIDAASRMTHVPASAMRPPPSDVLSAHTDYVTAVAQRGDRLIIMLDLDKVLLLHPAAASQAAT